MIIVFNVIYNLGFIYTIVRDFVMFYLDDARTPIKTMRDYGKNIG